MILIPFLGAGRRVTVYLSLVSWWEKRRGLFNARKGSLPRMPSVTNIKKRLTPVKGRYFSDNKKTARSLHRLRATH